MNAYVIAQVGVADPEQHACHTAARELRAGACDGSLVLVEGPK